MGLRKSQILPFSKSPISAALQQIFIKIFLELSYDRSQNGILWFMSRLLTSFEKNDMVENMEIHKMAKMALSLPLISQMVGIHNATNEGEQI